MDLAFEILFLFSQALFQDFDLGRRATIFQSHRELGGDLMEQIQILWVKCIPASAAQDEHSERTARTHKRDATQGSKSFRQKISYNLGFKALHLFLRENQRGARLQGKTSRTIMGTHRQA